LRDAREFVVRMAEGSGSCPRRSSEKHVRFLELHDFTDLYLLWKFSDLQAAGRYLLLSNLLPRWAELSFLRKFRALLPHGVYLLQWHFQPRLLPFSEVHHLPDMRAPLSTPWPAIEPAEGLCCYPSAFSEALRAMPWSPSGRAMG
jgi:hypothetical protein